ncbi:MAG: hypothetical protein M0D57_17190 [Sphingobacteriales bacterium JAD_PAG50586_3]|nr:MAG: hypothetical protein M0D57_17190 [Sphingobacteriales bacterium JAD_PAG50586_3]
MVRYKQLTSAAFISALALLLLNDFYLKATFGNWFTGKLSDFAGLFIFPMFWAILFPKQSKAIYIITAITFVVWKSIYSQWFIDGFNDVMPFALERTVDMGDCIALFILPISYYYLNRKEVYTLSINPAYIIPIAAFAFVATSQTKGFVINDAYSFNYSIDSLRSSLSKEFHQDTSEIQVAPKSTYLKVDNFKSCAHGYMVTCTIWGNSTKSNIAINSILYNCDPTNKEYSDKELKADFSAIVTAKLGGKKY